MLGSNSFQADVLSSTNKAGMCFHSCQEAGGAVIPTCNGALMRGYAFSIEDALIASRWAEQIATRGYRVVVTPYYRKAEEIIEVYIPNAKAPTFRVHRTTKSVLITDCIGLTLSFSTLADALLAMAPLSKPAERAMLKGADPARLPAFSVCPARSAGSMWSRAGRSVLEFSRTWALRRELD